MTRTRTAALMTAAVSALGLMLASGGAMAQANGANDAQAKARQIVVEGKADEAKTEEAKAPAAEEKAEAKAEEKAEAKAEEAPAKDATATLTDEQKGEVAKAIEESNAKAETPKAEEPAVKVVEEPAPVVKKVEKKVTSKVVIVEKNGVFLKVRKYSNGKYKVLGYAHGYGYEEPSHDYGYSHNYSGSYGHSGGYNSYGGY